MRTKTIYSIGILLFLILGKSGITNAQNVTKYSGIHPDGATFPFTGFIWSDYELKPVAYSAEMISKFSLDGSSISSNKSYEVNGYLEDDYVNILEIDGNYVYNAYHYVFATDMGGNPIWAIEPNYGNTGITGSNSICESNSGDVLIFAAKEQSGSTYLTVAEVSVLTGNLITYREFLLNIPSAATGHLSDVTTANLIQGEGYFLTLKSSMFEAYTISMDFGLNIIDMNKQEVIMDGSQYPLYVHEILPTSDREMFFVIPFDQIHPANSRNGVLVGKLNFNHEFTEVKYVEPEIASCRFEDLINNRGVIVETEESVFVNMDVDGYGTIATLKDGVTFALRYYDGSRVRAALLQYTTDFHVMAQATEYIFGNHSSEYVNSNNIVKDHRDRIHMKTGVSRSFGSSVMDTCYYSLIPENDFLHNCAAFEIKVHEFDLERLRTPTSFDNSENEFEIIEVDINHSDMSFGSELICSDDNRSSVESTVVSTLPENISVSVYPNPSSGDVFVTLSGIENVKVDIFTTGGELIRSEKSATNGTLRLEGLPVGFYLLKVTDSEGRTINKKIVVQ